MLEETLDQMVPSLPLKRSKTSSRRKGKGKGVVCDPTAGVMLTLAQEHLMTRELNLTPNLYRFLYTEVTHLDDNHILIEEDETLCLMKGIKDAFTKLYASPDDHHHEGHLPSSWNNIVPSWSPLPLL